MSVETASIGLSAAAESLVSTLTDPNIKSNQIKSHLFVSVASIARFHSAIDKISAMKTIK